MDRQAEVSARTRMPPVSVQVRFADVDSFGHVNHVTMLSYCEFHRVHMLGELDRSTGEAWMQAGFVVARLEVDYHAPIPASTVTVEVDALLGRIGRTSVHVNYTITAAEMTAAQVSTVLVRVEDGQPVPITPVAATWLRDNLGP